MARADLFYQHRETPSRRPEDLVPEALRRFELYDQPALQQSFVQADAASTKTASLILEGITCAACIWLNERHVNALPGVLDFSVNQQHRAARALGRQLVSTCPTSSRRSARSAMSRPSVRPGPPGGGAQEGEIGALRRLAVAGLGAMQVMMLADCDVCR